MPQSPLTLAFNYSHMVVQEAVLCRHVASLNMRHNDTKIVAHTHTRTQNSIDSIYLGSLSCVSGIFYRHLILIL